MAASSSIRFKTSDNLFNYRAYWKKNWTTASRTSCRASELRPGGALRPRQVAHGACSPPA